MKYFQDTATGELFAYELDGSQDYLIYKSREIMGERDILDDAGEVTGQEQYVERTELTNEFINANFITLTEPEVDTIRSQPPPAAPPSAITQLADVLVAKGILTAEEVDGLTLNQDAITK